MATSIPSKTWILLVSLSTGLGVVAVSDIGGILVRPWNIILFIGLTSLLFNFCRMEKLVNRDFIYLCLIYILSNLLSVFNAIDIFEALRRSAGNVMLVAVAVLFSQIKSQSHLLTICKYVILTGAFFSVLAILELYLYQAAPEIYSLLHTFDVGSNEISKLGQFGELRRARGYFVEPNEFSQYLLLPIGLFLASLKYQRNMFGKRMGVLVFFALFSAQVLSLSRGGFLGIFCQLMVLWFGTRRLHLRRDASRFFKLICLVVVLLIIVYQLREVGIIGEIQLWSALEAMFNRFLTSGSNVDPTASLRAQAIMTGLSVWLSSPASLFFGVGAGNLGLSELSGATTSNWVADILAEIGVVGLLSFITLISFILANVSAKRSSPKANSKDDSGGNMSIIFLLPVAGLLSGGMTYACHNLFVFWLALGLLAAAARSDSQPLGVKE